MAVPEPEVGVPQFKTTILKDSLDRSRQFSDQAQAEKEQNEKAAKDVRSKGPDYLGSFTNKKTAMEFLVREGKTNADAVKLTKDFKRLKEFYLRGKNEEGLAKQVVAGTLTEEQAVARMEVLNSSRKDALPSEELGSSPATPVPSDGGLGAYDMGSTPPVDYMTQTKDFLGGIGTNVSTKGLRGLNEGMTELDEDVNEAQRNFEATQKENIQEEKDALAKQMDAFQFMQATQKEASREVSVAIRAGMDDLNARKIDPFRIYRNGFAAIGAAIATAVGAYAQALSPGKIPNTALLILEKAEKMDFLAQKEEYDRAQDKLKMADNLYGKLMAQHGSEEKAMLYYQAITKQYLAAETRRREVSATSGVRKAEAARLAKKLDIDAERIIIQAQQGNVANSINKARLMGDIAKQERASETGRIDKEGLQIGKVKANFETVGLILDNYRSVADGKSIEPGTGDLGALSAGVGTTVGEAGDLVKLIFSPVISDNLQETITSLLPFIADSLYAIIKTGDPQGRVTDLDAKYFEPRGITWYDLSKRSIFNKKAAAWNKIADTVAELKKQHGSRYSEYINGLTLKHKTPGSPMQALVMEMKKSSDNREVLTGAGF